MKGKFIIGNNSNVRFRLANSFKSIYLIALFILSFNVYAQRNEAFIPDSAQFNKQVQKAFSNSNVLDPDKDSLSRFLFRYNTRQFNDEEKERICEVLNRLQYFKARPYPDYLDYFKALSYFLLKNKPPEMLKRWQEGLISLLQNDKLRISDITNYFLFTQNLLTGRYIYKSQPINWIVSNDNYQFYVDSVIKVKFINVTITCYAKNDSMKIIHTNGILDPIKNIWYGKKGLASWERAGYPLDSIYAELNNYILRVNRSDYSADSVSFMNKYYFGTPVLGRLEDMVMHVANIESVSYPQFNSYENNFHWSEMYPGIDYDGGFSFQGYKIVGLTVDQKDAMLTFKNKDTVLMIVKSKFITFLKESITSNHSEIKIFIKKDTIFHPSLYFTYFVKKREINLTKNEDFISQSQYIDSYHKVFMNFEQITWRLSDPFINFTMLKSTAIGNANFKSFNFFNLYEYEKIQGYDDIHPLAAIKNYSKRIKSETFTAIDFADFLNKPIEQTRSLLIRLAVDGYIYYNPETDLVKINDMLYTTIESRFKKRDYDVINFLSTTNNPVENASLYLNNFDLHINGVNEIFLSDSQNVVIYPANGEITLKKNRDFTFDGIVSAGLFTFFGKQFRFSYDTFKIDLKNVDSMKMSALSQERDFYNRPLLIKVNSTVENISGDILIDDPSNKSGLQSLSQYPIFNSRKNSFIYFDDKSIYNGVYKRDRFYFEVYPYSIDSIDNFDKNTLKFDGNFVSADIFPPFEDKIYIMEDTSLGFRKAFAEEGMPMYKGKGVFYNKIKISNKGLRGDGRLTFLTSTIFSDDFLFFPDSTQTLATQFNIKKQTRGIEYPSVQAKDIAVRWLPYTDQLFTQSTSSPYMMYDNQAVFSGKINLKPTGITGNGRMDVLNATMNSNLLAFHADDFKTDTADLTLKSPQSDTILLKTDNLKVAYDFNLKTGQFQPNGESIKLDLPENQYIAFVDKVKWLSDIQKLNFTTEKSIRVYEKGEYKTLPLEQRTAIPLGSHFISVNMTQDSLSFISPTAEYDLNRKLIYADQVHYIEVADALIYPHEGDVYVERKAFMRQLDSAEILANTDTKYHNFYKAKVNIKSKLSYSGGAYYNYTDENSVPHKIYFAVISVDDSLRTKAWGNVTQTDSLSLSPYFAFYGNIELLATSPFLTFRGNLKINHSCPQIFQNWLKFETEINPKDIYIPVNLQPKSNILGNLFSGDFIGVDSVHIYPSFLSARKFYADELLVAADGFLHYDKLTSKYIISSKEKIVNPDTTGSLISLHRYYCLLHSEGNVKLGVDFGHFNMHNTGFVNHDIEKNQVTLDLLTTMDFFLSGQALEIFAKEVDTLPCYGPINIQSKMYNKKLNEYLGTDLANKLRDDISLYGSYQKMPEQFDHTIVFTQLNMKWNHQTQSYRSEGKIGIGNIMGTQINKLVDGKLEIIKRRSGDIMNLLIKLDDNNWYMFSYSRGLMQVLSSNETYNTIIYTTKAKDRKAKEASIQAPYQYVLATDEKFKRTIDRLMSGKELEEELTPDDNQSPQQNKEENNEDIQYNP